MSKLRQKYPAWSLFWQFGNGGEQLEQNPHKLFERLRWGAYQAYPVRRVYIPKADGRLRLLGILVLEDNIVQGVTAQICSAI